MSGGVHVSEEAKKKSPLVIGLMVACLILASGIGYLVYMKMTEEERLNPRREPGVLMKLGDERDGLIVNVGGVNSGRFLKISIIAEIAPASASGGASGTPEEARILDAVLHLLRSQRIEDFDPNRQFQLKELIRHEIGEVVGQDRVYDVYITNFILQ